jgi:ubiquinone/menaquinone biosynthesis C-methylase UbiE
MFFRIRKSRIEPFALTMAAASMGERVLQIGLDDPGLASALAAKVGLSGTAALVVDNESEAARAKSAAERAGVFLDVQVTPLDALPFEHASFDLIVVHAMRGLLTSSEQGIHAGVLREGYRVLRAGGRSIVIESAPRGGLAGLLRAQAVDEDYIASGGAESVLKAAGFHPVRTLAVREGYRFTEGLKSAAGSRQ